MNIKNMRIAIYGCGAMGTVLGAFLTKADLNVELIDVYEAHVNKLNSNGATLVGLEDLNVPVKALLPTQMDGIYDLIILLCKQTANPDAFKILKEHMNDDSTILTIQNGVPEPSLLKEFKEEQVLGGTILWAATFQEPGISYVSEPLKEKKVYFEIGTINGQENQRVRDTAEVLRCMGPTNITNNLIGARWTKVLINSAVSGLSAATGNTFGFVIDSKKCRKIIGYIAKEAGQCAKADCVNFDPYAGIKLDRILKMGNIITRKVFSLGMKIGFKNMKTGKASMLQDLEKGKLTEVDMINGFISQVGKKHGIPTPMNDKIVEIVHGIEQGKLPLSSSNLDLFKI